MKTWKTFITIDNNVPTLMLQEIHPDRGLGIDGYTKAFSCLSDLTVMDIDVLIKRLTEEREFLTKLDYSLKRFEEEKKQ